MTNYKGVEIDGVVYTSEADVDAKLEKLAVEAYVAAVALYYMKPTQEHALYSDEKAANLVNNFGYSWVDVERIERSVYAELEA